MSQSQKWHEQGEQSAGALRLHIMWLLYAWCGKSAQKVVTFFVMLFIYPFARPARRALKQFYDVLHEWECAHTKEACYTNCTGVKAAYSADCTGIKAARSADCTGIKAAYSADCVPGRQRPGIFRHMLGFAWSLADKTDACTLKKNLPRMTVRDDEGWRDFRDLTIAHKGAFLISTHVGTIEVLPALAACVDTPVPHVHAFQQMGHDAVFMKMFMKHFDATALTLHAVENIGVETAVEMQAAIGRGEFVLMAGDRVSAGSGKTLAHDFLGRRCRWPKGVFTFAKLMESPVFFVTCVSTGWNAYECRFVKFKPGEGSVTASMLDQYVAFLQEETLAHPDQWYQFYDFFASMPENSRL